MDAKEEVNLSTEEITALKGRIQQEINNIQNNETVKTRRRRKKSPETIEKADRPEETGAKRWNRDIYLAAHSGDTELYGLASVLVFFLVRPFFSNVAAKYQNSAKKPEIEDFMNDLYIKIFQMLDRYNPEFTPITWLKPWATAVFQETRDKETGIATTHYFQNTLTTVRKARNELELAGKTDPSDYDIYEYLSDHYPEKHISLAAITRCRTQNFSMVTADTNPYLENSDLSKSPETAMLIKDQSDEFKKLKDTLTPRSRSIIEIEYEYVRNNGDVPDIIAVLEPLRRTEPSLTQDDVSRMVSAAHQEVRRAYNRMKNRKQSESVITLNAWQWDDASLEEEERMLLQAIEEDPSILEVL